ncbi:hypothetical protein KUCAC02_026277 [Chaenocephalus aceratus]|uniref:Uncharacterized protein n=1 Tax=Chaenocephalus aceratus TaxID=36190 RepID=A0ACB9VXT0_CHAAC|nr:hypothetical protein KUCAC02_026277 [Chaenocephalus aceratus]
MTTFGIYYSPDIQTT